MTETLLKFRNRKWDSPPASKTAFASCKALFHRYNRIRHTVIGITYAAIVIEFLVSIYAAVMIIRFNKKLG